MSEPTDYVIRSVTIAEVLDADGGHSITYQTEGDPADWDILGLLAYVDAVIRNAATLADEEDT